jgi:hypothetical protein
MKWFERFAESLRRNTDAGTESAVTKGWSDLPQGSGKRAKEARTQWIKSAMEKLDEACDESTRNLVMIGTCPHSYPKTRIREMRAELQRLGDIDKLLELMRSDTSWGGGSFYDYPAREGEVIYITKVPYSPKKFKSATTDTEKRLAYCHCGLVKHSRDDISPTFCCCSGGWVKQLWEGVFEEHVDVWLHESLLKGDDRCTHAVRIPAGFL